jgi:aspartate aminotransferase
MSEGTKPIAISKLVTNIKPSATIAAAAMARQMKAEGIQVFDFSLGEPDFSTPEHICKAAFKAMQDGHTHYTSANGIPELRKAIAKMYQRVYGLECGPEQIVVSNGAKHSLSNALTTVCGPGDEVIIPTPYWVSYGDLVEIAGATFVLVETTAASGFKMTPAQFRAAITPSTRLMMLNSPGNPSGSVYTRAEQEALADIALEADIIVLSDEIY